MDARAGCTPNAATSCSMQRSASRRRLKVKRNSAWVYSSSMGPQNREKREQSARSAGYVKQCTSASTATRRYAGHAPRSAKGLTTPNTCILDGRVSRCGARRASYRQLSFANPAAESAASITAGGFDLRMIVCAYVSTARKPELVKGSPQAPTVSVLG